MGVDAYYAVTPELQDLAFTNPQEYLKIVLGDIPTNNSGIPKAIKETSSKVKNKKPAISESDITEIDDVTDDDIFTDTLLDNLAQSMMGGNSRSTQKVITEEIASDELEDLTIVQPKKKEETKKDVKLHSEGSKEKSTKEKEESKKAVKEDMKENTSDDEEDDTPEEDITLDSAFSVFFNDPENGDIIISDPWKDFRSHVISIYNTAEATTNYQSDAYLNLKSFANLAVAMIAGPVLVIPQQGEDKEAHAMFEKFITGVTDLDTRRIMILTRTEENSTDEEPIIDFLVFFIDHDSNLFLEKALETYEKENIAIDFLYAIYNKAWDRRTTRWTRLEYLDGLIEDTESSKEDVEFFLDLVSKDPSTVTGENTVEKFIDDLCMPMELMVPFIHSAYLSLAYFMANASIEDGKILEIPNGFAMTKQEETNHEETKMDYNNTDSEDSEIDEISEEELTEVVVNTDPKVSSKPSTSSEPKSLVVESIH